MNMRKCLNLRAYVTKHRMAIMGRASKDTALCEKTRKLCKRWAEGVVSHQNSMRRGSHD